MSGVLVCRLPWVVCVWEPSRGGVQSVSHLVTISQRLVHPSNPPPSYWVPVRLYQLFVLETLPFPSFTPLPNHTKPTKPPVSPSGPPAIPGPSVAG